MRLNGFADSNNISVIDGTPYFQYSGTSFVEKVKNGISLDYLFSLNDFDSHNFNIQKNCITQEEDEESTQDKHLYTVYDEIEQYESNHNISSTNKSKHVHINFNKNTMKQRQMKQMRNPDRKEVKETETKMRRTKHRKPNIRQNGYNDKMFIIGEYSHLNEANDYYECKLVDDRTKCRYCGRYEDDLHYCMSCVTREKHIALHLYITAGLPPSFYEPGTGIVEIDDDDDDQTVWEDIDEDE